MMTDPLIAATHEAIQRGDMPRAEATLRQILQADPANAWALNLLGGVLAEVGQVEAAVEALAAAQEIQPDDPISLANRAALLYRLGREEEGIPLARKSIALQPDNARTHMILAEALLRRGEWTEGWREYEWRTRMPNYPRHGRADLPQPPWDGGEIAGKTILIHAEQGLGDMLWMIRYVPLLAQRGARVIIECEPPLQSPLSRVEGAWRVIARGQPLPDFHLHCPVMSLPRAFATTVATIPANVPYLRSDERHQGDWAARLPAFAGLTIGIAWSGGPRASRRKCPPGVFEGLMTATPGVRWVSLQVAGPHVDRLNHPGLIDPTAALRDFDDTAALVARLDLMISIDSVVAHLAGAMGKPVWTLLTHAADWRWMKDRADSPWYPTMRLFRQKARGDWPGITADVERELRLLATTTTIPAKSE